MRKERVNLPFTGISSFCRVPVCENWSQLDADVAILGVPFDLGTQVRPGARFGPRGVREASTIYSIQDAGVYDHEFDKYFLEGVRVVDCGDVDMIHMNAQKCLQNTYEDVLELLSKNVIPVIIGGDHSVPVPVTRAMKDIGPFHVIQFDAHLDFVDEKFGVREGQGNPMRRISEMKHVSGITQIGIRGQGSSSRQDFDDARAYGSTIVGPRQFRQIGAQGVIDMLPKGTRFYVTIDCDVLDPTIAPGTGTPSPGGLDYYEVTDVLRGIAERGEVIGFDFCEVAPVYDPTEMTCQVTARIILDFLSAIFDNRKTVQHNP